MKTSSVFLIAAVAFISMAARDVEAGWRFKKDSLYRGKNPIEVEQTTTSPSYCFDTGFDFSAFLSGVQPKGAGQNGLGGGVGFSYFFHRNVGVEIDYSAHGQGVAQQVFGGRLIYRIPLDGGGFSGDWAPYVFGGGGGVSAGSTQGYYSVGGGIDLRLESWGCVGFFADYSYNFVNAALGDFSQFRAGVRLPF